ncbi:hypothetical protein COCNU_01G019160 [Cocos nucifera]|uniref:Uncharacterized protein n=1 Tax=Cocos nucifera TaxID=13894 RepID=A0A8K0HWN1_COCNU|nr:hypothetical protein COCNU_01G019160 [Cocos nucifera]
MVSFSREFRDENMMEEQSSQTSTIQREIEKVPQDDSKDISSRQDYPNPKESDERLALENLSGSLAKRFELSEANIERLRDHYHIPSRYRQMAPSEEGIRISVESLRYAIKRKLGFSPSRPSWGLLKELREGSPPWLAQDMIILHEGLTGFVWLNFKLENKAQTMNAQIEELLHAAEEREKKYQKKIALLEAGLASFRDKAADLEINS